MNERIVITGYGLKVPGGYNRSHFRDSLLAGQPCLDITPGVGPKNQDLYMGQVHEDLLDIDGVSYKRYPRISRLAIAAAVEAVHHSGLELPPGRTGVFMGTAMAGVQGYEETAAAVIERNPRAVPLHGCGLVHGHSLSSAIAGHLRLNGVTRTLHCGCSSSIEAIQDAQYSLLFGKTDVCLVGGADAANCLTTIYGFAKIRAIALDAGIAAGVPFDPDSAGFVISEGASVLVLERESHARQRGATIHGVIEGVETNNDGLGINLSDPEGLPMRSLLRQMSQGRKPTFINSLALGMKRNDQSEAGHARHLFDGSWLTSIKGMTGHTFGASGTMQVISTLIGMKEGFIPGTIRLRESAAEGWELPIALEPIYTPVETAIITSHGYGGNNACLWITNYDAV